MIDHTGKKVIARRAWGTGVAKAAGIGASRSQDIRNFVYLDFLEIMATIPKIIKGNSNKYSSPIPWTACLPIESPEINKKFGEK